MSHQKYEKYKDSGVPWLGEIPEGWISKKLTHCIKYTVGFTPESGNSIYYGEGYYWANISDLGPKFLEHTEKQITQEAVDHFNKKPAQKGSLLFSFKLSVGQVSIAKNDIYTNEAIAAFKSDGELHISYFYYLAPIAIIENASENIYGAKILNQESIGNAKLVVPPLTEQKAIAVYLDFKTAQIDELIGKKEELLKALAEKRTAIITHAVTRGLNPTAKLKPTNIPWLGEIPENWEVKKLKQIVSYIGSGKTPRGGAEVYTNYGIMVIRSQNVYDDGLRLDDVVFVDEELEAGQSNTRLSGGDVLLNITGASIARTAIVPDDLPKANVNQHVCIFRPKLHKITSKYLHNFFVSYAGKSQILASETGTSREGLNFQQAGNIFIALPPIPEQCAIAEYLDSKLEQIDQVSQNIKLAIEKLKEYRTAIITNAVTGKIKVA